jgi:DNA invertase Pin-like site-specific DNA recombinase
MNERENPYPGIIMGKKAAKTEDNRKERVILLKYYRSGMTTAEMAELLGWSVRTVYSRLRFHGISGGDQPDYCRSCGHVRGSIYDDE